MAKCPRCNKEVAYYKLQNIYKICPLTCSLCGAGPFKITNRSWVINLLGYICIVLFAVFLVYIIRRFSFMNVKIIELIIVFSMVLCFSLWWNIWWLNFAKLETVGDV